MKQLSGGCVAGFLSGVVVAVFSRTLVLILGLSVVLLQVIMPSSKKNSSTPFHFLSLFPVLRREMRLSVAENL